jgi:membrane-associated phospholipid phosphatase
MYGDERLGQWLYEFGSKFTVLRILATIASTSSDEVIWFAPAGIFITAAFGRAAYRGLLAGDWPLPSSCAEQVFSDMFGTMCLAGVAEMIGKLLFHRARPLYAPQRTDYSLPAEKFSMPSGHSLRAAVICFWLINNPHAEIICRATGLVLPSWRVAIPWACAVGLSRVLKGKVSAAILPSSL